MPTTNEQDKALHAAADAHKADLSTGAGVHVPTGDEATPPKRQDRNDLRKAMFAKSDRMRAEGLPRSATDMPVQPGAENPDQPRQRETLHLPQAPVSPTSTAPLQTENAFVTLAVEGGTIQVAQTDIDRAGSPELYLRRRALDQEEVALQSERNAIARERLEMTNRLRADNSGTTRLGQDDPASRGADPASQDRNDPGATGVDDDEMAARLSAQIYSGDANDAKKAIAELIKLSRSRGEQLTEDQLVERAAAKLRQSAPNATAPANPTPVNPVVAAVNAAVNRMARAEYADVCNDEVARTAVFAKFQQLCALPANKDRRAVDIARDACDWGRSTLVNPRARVVEQKRGMPVQVAASGAQSTTADEPEAQSDSSYIEELNNRRNFGRRAKP